MCVCVLVVLATATQKTRRDFITSAIALFLAQHALCMILLCGEGGARIAQHRSCVLHFRNA